MNKQKTLIISAVTSIVLAVLLILASIILYETNNVYLGDALLIISAVFGVASLVIMVIYAFTTFNSEKPKNFEYKDVKVKDVKSAETKEKTSEEKLYDQYVNLYKQKLITKEDLDNKKKELLG